MLPSLHNSTLGKVVHVRFGIPDAYIESDLREQCEMMMDFLGWTYEVAKGPLGYLNFTDPLTSTGLTGGLVNGQIDILCYPFMMTWKGHEPAYNFTYPTGGFSQQVYLINHDALLIHQSESLFRPFSLALWLMVLAVGIVTIILFSAMRAIITSSASITRSIIDSISRLTELSMSVDFGSSSRFSGFTSLKFATILWLLFWGPILQLYKADLSFLTLSDRLYSPFADFEDFVQQLSIGRYQLQVEGYGLPICPISYGNDDDCRDLFERIFDQHAPLRDDREQLGLAPGNVVTVLKFDAIDISNKLSHFVGDLPFKSKLLAVHDDQVALPSATFPVSKNFRHISELNYATISLQQALRTVKQFRRGPLTVPFRIDPIPLRSQFTLFQLASAFQVLGFGFGLSLVVLILEVIWSSIFKKRTN